MRVREHKPSAWFLLETDQGLILDVNCSHTVFDYSFAIVLNAAERERYAEEGTPYLDRLAESIAGSAPIAKGSKSIFKARKVSEQCSEQVDAAIFHHR